MREKRRQWRILTFHVLRIKKYSMISINHCFVHPMVVFLRLEKVCIRGGYEECKQGRRRGRIEKVILEIRLEERKGIPFFSLAALLLL